jgi:uncharacterized protein with NRDE domain
MCLLTVLFGVCPEAPAVVGANRDERFARPAEPMQVLRPAAPRILGGRDVHAGGTWLAVNEHGVYAGLTNRPSRLGHDPARRSRGAFPLLLTEHASAEEAVQAFQEKIRCADYNACWLLVGDRQALYYVAVGDTERPEIIRLSPGIHVLENSPLDAASAKAEMVRGALAPAATWCGPPLLRELHAVLRSHDQPPPSPRASPWASPRERDDAGARRAALSAACVHTTDYGTRSSTLLVVPADPAAVPHVHHANGPPCTQAFRDESALWG